MIKNKKTAILIFLFVVIALVIFVVLVSCFLPKDSSVAPKKTTSFSNQSNSLNTFLGNTTYSIDDLTFEQLVTVKSNGQKCIVSMYEKNNDSQWTQVIGDTAGYVGYNGVTQEIVQGDFCTPIGLFSLGDAFYLNEKPETGLNSFKILDNYYWVDDPMSRFYNQLVVGTENKDWDSAEHMIEFVDYEYGCVIEDNTYPIIAGRGAAIFFHCGQAPTGGCVAVSVQDMKKYL